MPRLPLLDDRSLLSPDAVRAWDRVEEARGGVAGPYLLYLHAPAMTGPIAELAAELAAPQHIDCATVELAVMTSARLTNCEFQWYHHSRRALVAGVSPETVAAIGDGRFGKVEDVSKGIVEFTRQLVVDNRVEDGAFDAVREQVGFNGLTELLVAIGQSLFVSTMLNAVEMEPPVLRKAASHD